VFYRKNLNNRFTTENIKVRFTEGLLGYSDLVTKKIQPKEIAYQSIIETYNILDNTIKNFPLFKTSFEPMDFTTNDEVIKQMMKFSKAANVGPMAGVAGAFSEKITEKMKNFSNECYFENGGDISLNCISNILISIFPGWKNDDINVSIELPPGNWGIASSSGKYGRSISLGTADMVTVIDASPIKADMFATAIGNEVNLGTNIEELISSFPELKGIAVYHNKKFHYKGNFPLKF